MSTAVTRVTVREAFEAGIEAHRRSRWRQRGVSALYWALMLALGVACARSVESAYELALVVPAAYAADAASAAVHVYLDHRPVEADGAVAEGWLSRELDRGAHGFQVHHSDPMRFVRDTMVTGQYGQLEILVLFTLPVALATALLVPWRAARARDARDESARFVEPGAPRARAPSGVARAARRAVGAGPRARALARGARAPPRGARQQLRDGGTGGATPW